MEAALRVLAMACVIFPFIFMFVAGILLAIFLIRHEEGTLSPRKLYRIYRKKLVYELKNRRK